MKTFYENVFFAVEEKRRLDYLLESAQDGDYPTEKERNIYIQALKDEKSFLWVVLEDAVECERKNPGQLQLDFSLMYLEFCSVVGERFDSRKENQ